MIAQWGWKKILIFVFVSAVFTGPLLYSFGLIPSLKFMFLNSTRSAPVGIYFSAFNQTLSSGDYVVLYPPEEAKPYLYGRHWTIAPFLLKQVAALPGEQYERKMSWLMVGRQAAYAFRSDPDGLPLPVPPDGVFTVPESKVLLVSWDEPQSFDSRYFGPVDQSLIVRKVVPGIVLPSVIGNLLLGRS